MRIVVFVVGPKPSFSNKVSLLVVLPIDAQHPGKKKLLDEGQTLLLV